MGSEFDRLQEDFERTAHWRRWGPYLSERQWGTVREDYSENGEAWSYFTYSQAVFRSYRWGEDGIGGVSDNHQRICFAFAFWNGKDPILKERLFGLTNQEGNHGEDVKEMYYYVDNTPTHSYMKYLYRYPIDEFPYDDLLKENRSRTSHDLEYELVDTGIFNENRFFDIYLEYAKEDPESLWIKATVINRSSERAELHILPQIWFRNTWDWREGHAQKPRLFLEGDRIHLLHGEMDSYYLYPQVGGQPLFTENTTNREKLFGTPNPSPYVKDSFHRYLIQKEVDAVNPAHEGTKCALHTHLVLEPLESKEIVLLLTKKELAEFIPANNPFSERRKEADEFYSHLQPIDLSAELKMIQRRAWSELLWNKQFYHYVVEEWAEKSYGITERPLLRKKIRNKDWNHLYNDDILSLPDKWEYPCFFSWDTAFHTLPLALIDPEYAKRQLLLLTREWYMHPNGQIPASEWAFDDVNPPVHAWAAWRVFKIEEKWHKNPDRVFLERVFQKLLLNFTWWVNRKDVSGKNIFQGGFLGLDNISVFDRSTITPKMCTLYQSDATSWMGMYCLNMLGIALHLAQENKSYEDLASKFLEHFIYIADAINYTREERLPIWNEEDGFYYDLLIMRDGQSIPLKVRSVVGLIPILAVVSTNIDIKNLFPGFTKRMNWFLDYRKDLCQKIGHYLREEGQDNTRLLAIVNPDRLRRLLQRMFDEEEFLSPYGIRSLSKYHKDNPFVFDFYGERLEVHYEPAESSSKLFGGNSNWRGPIWMPLNILFIEALQKYHAYFGDAFKVEFPTRSGNWMNLLDISHALSARLVSIFTLNNQGERPFYGKKSLFKDPLWRDELLFYEYFHGDIGAGIGACHQAGWTALISKLIHQLGACSWYE